jgi:ArpU family phage transcriptional regulator
MLPKVTTSYSLLPPTLTNQFQSSTEDAAIQVEDFERERDQYLIRVEQAVNHLNYKEHQIIIERYMRFEEKFDYKVYNEIGMSERGYYQVKGRAYDWHLV